MSEHAASTVVAQYLSALAGNDLDRARGLLADGFTFRGPAMEHAVDRDTFLSKFGRKYDHVGDLRIPRQAEREGQVASLYELDAQTPHGATTFLMTEWNTVRDGRIESALLSSTPRPGRTFTLGRTGTATDHAATLERVLTLESRLLDPHTRRDPAEAHRSWTL